MDGNITIAAVGDVNLSHYIREYTRRHGPLWAFEPCRELLDADVRIGNFECVAFRPGWPDEPPLHVDNMHVAWHEAAGVAQARFSAVSVANNHILDFGPRIAWETIEFLRTHGVAPVGFGPNQAEARRPVLLDCHGVRIGLLAYVEDMAALARQVAPGPAYAYEPNMRADIADLRRAGAHVVIVSLHADVEFADHPAPHRVALSRRLIDAGADLVLGHHPHVTQGIERHGRGLIAYSLGNFIFPVAGDSYLERGSPWTDKSFVLRVRVSRRGYEAHEVVPVRIEPRGRPVPMDAPEAGAFLERHERLCAALQDAAALEAAWLETGQRWLRTYIEWIASAAKEKGLDQAIQQFLPELLHEENLAWLRPVLRQLQDRLPPRPFLGLCSHRNFPPSWPLSLLEHGGGQGQRA